MNLVTPELGARPYTLNRSRFFPSANKPGDPFSLGVPGDRLLSPLQIDSLTSLFSTVSPTTVKPLVVVLVKAYCTLTDGGKPTDRVHSQDVAVVRAREDGSKREREKRNVAYIFLTLEQKANVGR